MRFLLVTLAWTFGVGYFIGPVQALLVWILLVALLFVVAIGEGVEEALSDPKKS